MLEPLDIYDNWNIKLASILKKKNLSFLISEKI